MSDDANLDEFDGGAPEPPAVTYTFDPNGAGCESCSESVQRRFQSEDGLVCSDCKPWRV